MHHMYMQCCNSFDSRALLYPGIYACTVYGIFHPLQIRAGEHEQLLMSRTFFNYKPKAISNGWLPQHKVNSVQFAFDDDRLTGNETAGKLGLVEGDITKVTW